MNLQICAYFWVVITVIKYFSIARALSILGLTAVIFSWGLEKANFGNLSSSDHFFKYLGFICICLTSVGAGAVTTATFTLMMGLSQRAPSNVAGIVIV